MGRLRGGRIAWNALFLAFGLVLLTAGISSAQSKPEPPDAPKPQPSQTTGEEKKPENQNPSEGAAERTERMTVEAAHATIHMGEAAMVRARNWEASWLTGVYIEKGHTMLPLTFPQRRELYLQQTLATPGAYMKRMFAAGIDQMRSVPEQWDDGWVGYTERFASREGQFVSANTLAMLGNAALGYEPRYDQCQCSGFLRRTRHAIMRNFLTYNHSEQELRPQLGLYAGSFGGGVISTAWKPHPRNAFAEGGRAMLGQAGYGALLNFFIEFSRDINRKIGAKSKDSPRL